MDRRPALTPSSETTGLTEHSVGVKHLGHADRLVRRQRGTIDVDVGVWAVRGDASVSGQRLVDVDGDLDTGVSLGPHAELAG